MHAGTHQFLDEMMCWQEVDGCLYRMSGLISLVFSVHVRWPEGDDQLDMYSEVISRGLPRVASRGVLRVDVTAES